ncbi:MAG: NAD-dependent epimerase/dehydratase family protein [Dehalococcoidia bacterium]
MQTLVTGATGFLGSHIAERLVQRGDNVRALVRSSSRTSYLKSLGVELAYSDITDPDSLPAAMAGVDVVYHAAANVSDWGPWHEYKTTTIDGTRNMLRAASRVGVGRFLHVSTDNVYRYQDLAKGVDEKTPMETYFGAHDYYRRAKTAAEKIARHYHELDRVPVSIVRPALILGERDAAMMPGAIAFLKSATASYMGSGQNRLPCVYAGDVADLCIRAANEAQPGEVYIAVNEEYVTQRDLFGAIAEFKGIDTPKRSVPYRLLYAAAGALELVALLRAGGRRPDVTRYGVSLFGATFIEDNTKARTQLGWEPQVSMREAVRRSVEWARARKSQPVSS